MLEILSAIAAVLLGFIAILIFTVLVEVWREGPQEIRKARLPRNDDGR